MTAISSIVFRSRRFTISIMIPANALKFERRRKHSTLKPGRWPKAFLYGFAWPALRRSPSSRLFLLPVAVSPPAIQAIVSTTRDSIRWYGKGVRLLHSRLGQEHREEARGHRLCFFPQP